MIRFTQQPRLGRQRCQLPAHEVVRGLQLALVEIHIAASGTGLGLAIAHEAVEHFGGRLSFLNRPGGGLKVAITLPLLKAP